MEMETECWHLVGWVVEPPLNHPWYHPCGFRPISAHLRPILPSIRLAWPAPPQVGYAPAWSRRCLVGTLLQPPLQGWLKHPCR